MGHAVTRSVLEVVQVSAHPTALPVKMSPLKANVSPPALLRRIWRCLTDAECLSIGRQISDSSLAMSSLSLPLSITQQLQGMSPSNRSQVLDMEMMPKLLRPRVGNGLCVFKCPEGYTLEEKPSGPECVECTDVCPKVCDSITIHFLKDSEELRGCTKIVGDLTLHIKGGMNVDKELTKNLGNVREITGILKVTSSHALLTLHFFRSLEIIGGNQGSSRYSLIVKDNENLEDLFQEQQTRRMVIQSGNISFVGNKRLCKEKINNFTNSVGAPPQDEQSRDSNGRGLPCK
ncbi:insulin receptor [Plakobranchus ocellatus]|uniref:Insulin receptor n=1 Tax=Plakobranchus ocellatus TaxID=259542 RepID=A0AAV4CGA5_9GAST|nr:insulin receptor [Plakobranchus ocellatus]